MRHLSFSLTIKELKGYHDELKIIIKKNGPAVTSNTLYGRLTHIRVLAYVEVFLRLLLNLSHKAYEYLVCSA